MIKTKRQKSGEVQVTFAVDDAGEAVYLVADVNGWEPVALKKRSNNTRSLSVTVPEGSTIRFRYRTEAGHWFNDPDCGHEPNEYGEANSVTTV